MLMSALYLIAFGLAVRYLWKLVRTSCYLATSYSCYLGIIHWLGGGVEWRRHQFLLRDCRSSVNIYYRARLQVLTSANVNMTEFWNIPACSLVEVDGTSIKFCRLYDAVFQKSAFFVYYRDRQPFLSDRKLGRSYNL